MAVKIIQDTCVLKSIEVLNNFHGLMSLEPYNE